MENPYQSPTTSESPSAPAVEKPQEGDPFAAALKFGVKVQLALLALTFLVLDGGVLTKQYVVGMIGYWIAVAVLMVRRRSAPTRGDILFLRYGNIALLVAVPFIARLVYRAIGESPLRGLDRWY
jgi:hypothetical protein